MLLIFSSETCYYLFSITETISKILWWSFALDLRLRKKCIFSYLFYAFWFLQDQINSLKILLIKGLFFQAVFISCFPSGNWYRYKNETCISKVCTTHLHTSPFSIWFGIQFNSCPLVTTVFVFNHVFRSCFDSLIHFSSPFWPHFVVVLHVWLLCYLNTFQCPQHS